MSDFLDQKKQEIQARIAELEPLVQEYRRLLAAQEALEGAVKRGPGRPRKLAAA